MNGIEIEIGGRKRKFHYGLWTLGELLTHFDTDIAGFGKILSENPFKAIPAILYYGHLYAVKKDKQVQDFSEFDVYEWIEEKENTYADPDIEQLLNVVLESMKKNVPGLAAAVEDDKKK